MHKRIRLRRKTVSALAGLLLLVLLFAAALLLLRTWENKRYQLEEADAPVSAPAYAEEETPMTYYGGKWYTPKQGLETVLVIGLDQFSEGLPQDADANRNAQQADFLLLAVLDHDRKQYTALHLDRDTMTAVPVLALDGTQVKTVTEQLLMAHTYGSGGKDSCENTVKAVSELLYGVPIDHYVSLTMDAVAEVNDRAGGVRVEVLDDFSAVDPALVQGSEVTLTGDQALTYVRSRKGLEDSTNTHRMERQRQYLHGLHRQIDRAMRENPDFVPETAVAVSEHLVSDCTVTQLSGIGEAVSDYENNGIQTIPGDAVRGTYMEFYPDEAALKELVLQTFYEPADAPAA